MNSKYVFSPKMPNAAARRRQAMRPVFWVWGFFCLTLNSALAQNITPEAQRLFQQADTTTELNQKIRRLESALRLSPQFDDARLELAKALIQAQQFRRAIFRLDTVLSKNIKNAEAWFYKGRAHAEIGENNDARKSFAQALVLYLELGKAQLEKQSFDAALQSFDRSIEIAISTQDNARQAEAWFGKGRAHEAQGDTANAARSYRQCLRVQPNFKSARSALTNLERQAQLAAWYQTAEEAVRRSNWTTAAQNYQHVLAIDPNFKDAALKLATAQNKIKAQALADSAQALQQRQKFDEAIILLQQAMNLDANKRPDLQAQMAQITQAKQPTENRAKAAKSIASSTKTAPPVKPDTGVALAQDTTKRIMPDSSAPERQEESTAQKFWQTAIARWIIIGAFSPLLVAFVYLLWQKYWRNPPKPEPKSTVLNANGLPPAETVTQREELKEEKPVEPMDKIKTVALPKLDKYDLEQELGRGGMGRVYKARHIRLGRPAAIKVIRFETEMDADAMDERITRFRREAKAIAQFDHPNIVKLYDYEEKDGSFFMIMEYVDGLSVEQALKKNGRFSVQEALNVVNQTCLALAYAHEQGVVHRDIKPSNIMLTNAERKVKVVDFGVAKMLASTSSQDYTLKGMRLGSPPYMSPEQIEAQDLDGRTDIYSLGVVFYELLVGERPFDNKDGQLSSLFYAILNNAPPKLSAKRSEVSIRIEAMVEKMLAKKPEQRYQNAAEIIKALSTLEV